MADIGKVNVGAWKLDHIGVIVKDMDKALAYYQALGCRDFHPSTRTSFDATLDGKPAEGKNVSLHGKMGEMGLELIQPVSGDSLPARFLKKNGEGVQHLAFTVANLDEETAKMKAAGFKVVAGARFAAGGGHSFFDTEKTGGVCFQLMQLPK